MGRRFTEPALLIASGNAGKIREIEALLASYPIRIHSAKDYAIEEPEETGATFVENAELKARYYGTKAGLPALADDSGLVVEALDGAPGIYSARWAGETKDFSIAFTRIERELAERNATNLRAHFVCALSIWWPDGHVETVQGSVSGTLTFPPRGEHGFGYDPIFIPDGYIETFAELPADVKHRISHRADAFAQLMEKCF